MYMRNRRTRLLPAQKLLLGLFHFFALAFLSSSGTLTLQAQPANNNFANRITLTGTPVTVTGSTTGAGNETGENLTPGGNRIGSTVWYTWTAPATGVVVMDTFGSSFNTVLAA